MGCRTVESYLERDTAIFEAWKDGDNCSSEVLFGRRNWVEVKERHLVKLQAIACRVHCACMCAQGPSATADRAGCRGGGA